MAFLGAKSYRYVSKNTSKNLVNMCSIRFASSFYQAEAMPQLPEKADKETILKRPWAVLPFTEPKSLNFPIFSIKDGEYTGESVSLDEKYFNMPLRKDLIHNAFHYYRKLGYRTYKTTLTKGTTAGSGRKQFQQKGRGKARQGNRTAPHLRGGGKAHGRVPQDYTIDINGKNLNLAFKT